MLTPIVNTIFEAPTSSIIRTNTGFLVYSGWIWLSLKYILGKYPSPGVNDHPKG